MVIELYKTNRKKLVKDKDFWNWTDEFYNNLVNDIRDVGIPLVKDNIYGGMSTRRKPVSIFKWVSVDVPVKVKEVSPSNIETGDHVGKYKVELGVMKK